MNFNEFFQVVVPRLKKRLGEHKGLSIFAQQRAKFEGWLKVELCKILSEHFPDTLPEKDRIDLVAGNWAIELKTVNTNYRYDGVVNKSRPITDNTAGVCRDIEKLKKVRYPNKAVIFIAFPLEEGKLAWQTQLERIKQHLKELKGFPFQFSAKIPGVIYIGLV